tara:strand:+ start:34 stop:1056 length:1023 start_codon:yes stop_codon:yes gene_type:complete
MAFKHLNSILEGDALEKLKELPDQSVNMCMTSPPYWALRDYGVDKQLGLEPTFNLYINKLCDIFDEVKRVLRDDGTCWVNLGDTYFGSGKCAGGDGKNKESFTFTEKEKRKCHNCDKEFMGWKFQNFCGSACSGVDNTPRTIKGKLPDKTLTMIPMRFAIEMVNRGWILRNEVIWHKPNAMPASVKDRFTVDFEKIFFFTKNKKYWFEAQREGNNYYKTIAKKGQKRFGGNTAIGNETIRKDRIIETIGRNKRAVWSINTKPFKEAHFAVYPEELCETPIKAGCPEDGIVLDPFFGAGTTGLVALKQNKKFIGIELNPEYIKIANARLKPHLEQERLNGV